MADPLRRCRSYDTETVLPSWDHDSLVLGNLHHLRKLHPWQLQRIVERPLVSLVAVLRQSRLAMNQNNYDNEKEDLDEDEEEENFSAMSD